MKSETLFQKCLLMIVLKVYFVGRYPMNSAHSFIFNFPRDEFEVDFGIELFRTSTKK